MELSLCMIVRDEAARLGACLESVRDAVEEIVILDTGSKDETREIAAGYTDKVFDYSWQDDFSAARNASMAHATKPFILWLDADDVIDADQKQKLIALKARLTDEVDAVMLPYHYAFHEDGRPSLVFERERIVRRAAGFQFEGVVHEAMSVRGNVRHEDVVIRHTGRHGQSSNERNLAIYETWRARGRAMSARDSYYYARELRGAGELVRAQQAFAAFLARGDGWLPNVLDACVQRGECLLALGCPAKAKEAILPALAHGAPRAEALCALGACCLAAGELPAAAHWYRAALLCEPDAQSGAFLNPDAYGYVPLMQLCVILSRMGQEMEASKMNEQALLLRPGDSAALANRAYFAQRLAAEP